MKEKTVEKKCEKKNVRMKEWLREKGKEWENERVEKK